MMQLYQQIGANKGENKGEKSWTIIMIRELNINKANKNWAFPGSFVMIIAVICLVMLFAIMMFTVAAVSTTVSETKGEIHSVTGDRVLPAGQAAVSPFVFVDDSIIIPDGLIAMDVGEIDGADASVLVGGGILAFMVNVSTGGRMHIIWIIVLCCSMGFLMLGTFFLFMKYRYRCLQLNEELLHRTAVLEEQVEDSKAAIKVKSDFLSNVSHEIRTPLNAIMGVAQIIRYTSDEAIIDDCIEKMESSSQHLMGIVNDILDISKIESGNFVIEEGLFSLTSNIEFVVSMFKENARGKGLHLCSEVCDIQHDGIMTDKLRLNQVLINLMSNAVKFTDPGGTVELNVQELFHMDGDSVYRFSVRDNGIGIEPDQAGKLFTPFSQAHNGVTRMYGGTGLGLAISQNIVQMMGGDIELETEFGKGSVFQFTIRVPAKEKAEAPLHANPTNIKLPDFKGKRVLVVDDNKTNLSIASALLRLYGIMADTVESGKQAIKQIQQAQYDIVFMDQMMPEMDGIETTIAIRELGINVTIVALTACVVEGQRELMLEAGMNDYLSKPIENAELQRVLIKWLPLTGRN
jgi:signal transduction histidine kinase